MPKLQSQWEFGDLLAAPPPRHVFGLSELTASVKRILEERFGRIWVTGEITNARRQSSGHLYFTLKDASAQLSCVLFRGTARAFNRDLLQDGISVVLQGDLSVYEARGQYQLIVSEVELKGIGILQVAFEKLKQKLQSLGWFAAERKRPLPRFPTRLGVVTSATGAAFQDVLHVLRRRHPGMEVILASCRVQGQGAADEIACAIHLLNEWADTSSVADHKIDLILVTRGGGSLEDLWAFNEETVARAIYESTLPVVSAVGHEIDFTISDFIADFRAATPTAAAEIITEGFYSSREFVREAQDLLRRLVFLGCAAKREEIEFLIGRLARQHPRRWLDEQGQRLDDLLASLGRGIRHREIGCKLAFQALAQRLNLVQPAKSLAHRHEIVKSLSDRLDRQVQFKVMAAKQQLAHVASRLRLLSPQNVLERGYSITVDAATEQVIRSTDQVQAGQKLRTRLRVGEVFSVVETK